MKPIIQEGNFLKVINQTIVKGRHVDYLKGVVKDYEKYKHAFDEIFTENNSTRAIYLFRATYLNKKLAWRDIEIRGDQFFSDLAEIIVYSMDWLNDHLHGFSLPDKTNRHKNFNTSRLVFYSNGMDDDSHPTFKSSQIRICDIDYRRFPKLRFIFDFGDGHNFDINLKSIRKYKKSEKVDDFPSLVDQRGIAPEQYPDYE